MVAAAGAGKRLYVPHELAFRTQYAELKERSGSAVHLLKGTPGTLAKRSGTGRSYWYRIYQTAFGEQAEELIGREDDEVALEAARADIDLARWTGEQVRNLRKLGFQVADKGAAGVLVELHNAGLLTGGLYVVGTLGYMCWLNELGARAVSAQTQDIDFAAFSRVKLAAPAPWLDMLGTRQLGLVEVPGLSNSAPPTSLKRKGRDGLRVDLLTHGKEADTTVAVPALKWHAQTVPHYDYLLEDVREAAVLAGQHCVKALLPSPERFMWHKFFSNAARTSFPEKARKDLMQACTLAAVLFEQEDHEFAESWRAVPGPMKRVVRSSIPAMRRVMVSHSAALEAIQSALESE